MALGSISLKVISGVSTLAVCSAGAVLVGHDPRPASAPLTPPASAPASGTTTSDLVIPPSCGTVTISGNRGGGKAVTLSAAAQQAVQQIQAAGGDKARVRAILAALSASDRQMVIAYLRKSASGQGQCTGTTQGGGTTGSITASEGSGGPSVPVVISYVS